jgi:long-chain acyl-CoA synthetase
MNKEHVTTLGALFFWNVEQFRSDRLLVWKNGDRHKKYSTAGFADAVLRLAKWLTDSGLQKGDRIALICENRPEWHVVDFAAHLAQMVLVPVYPTLNAHQMEQILQHAGARIAFCGIEQMERLQDVRAGLPELEHMVGFDREGAAEHLDAILATVAPVTDAERDAFRTQVLAEDPETVATIVYTSGTTGTPKGVMLSHGNLIFDVIQSLKRLPERPANVALSVLPLSHVLERILCYGYLYRGIPIAYGDPHALRDLLAAYHPTVMGAVPRILEKMKDAIESKIAKMPAHRQRISKFLLGVGYDRMDGKKTLRSALHPIARLLMFKKVHEQMGNIEVFVCGGAWLNPDLERYFRALGFVVLQGYGLTETSPVITCNQYGAEKAGSVGRPIDGVEIRVDEEGEILTRGANVMKGYFREPEATAKVFRDGWFVTGDLGRIEGDNFLFITGRRKEMLLLSNGKNIYYAPIEQALKHSALIEQAFVVGEGRNYTSLILVPNTVALMQHAAERGIQNVPCDDLLLMPAILEAYREAIDSLQAGFSRYEQAKRFCFLKEEALLDIELVTPTQKVRRNVLERKYAKHIDRIYREDKPFVIPEMAGSTTASLSPVS